MNYNILAYVIYINMMVFIIVYVGRVFHMNGRIFILALFKGNVPQADQLNNILLVAYYLFNIGYAFLKLRDWQKVTGIELLVSSLSSNIGVLVLILAITHYFNMALIHFLSRKANIIH